MPASAEFVRQMMENLILSIIQMDDARRKSHFRHIGRDAGKLYQGAFSLFYFPDPEEDVFSDFSLLEQLVRLSDFFDRDGVQFHSPCHLNDRGCKEGPAEPFYDLRGGKGAPTPEARERLCTSLFFVGCIQMTLSGTSLLELRATAPVRSKTYSTADIPMQGNDGGTTIVLRAREMDRNVPGWDLTWLFSRSFVADLGKSWTLSTAAQTDVPDTVCSATFVFDNRDAGSRSSGNARIHPVVFSSTGHRQQGGTYHGV